MTMKSTNILSIDVTIRGIRYFNSGNRFIIFDCLHEGENVRLVGHLHSSLSQTHDQKLFENVLYHVHGTWESHYQYGKQFHFCALSQKGSIDRVALQRMCFDTLPTSTAEALYNQFGFYLGEAIKRSDRILLSLTTPEQLATLQDFLGIETLNAPTHTAVEHLQPKAPPAPESCRLDDLPDEWAQDISRHQHPDTFLADLYGWYLSETQSWLDAPRIKDIELHAMNRNKSIQSRAQAYLYAVLRHNERMGNTMMRFDKAATNCKRFVGELQRSDLDPAYFTIWSDDFGVWVQRTIIHSIISSLSRSLASFMNTTAAIANPTSLPGSLDNTQKAAVEMVLKESISIITGGPGTGKTFTTKIIIEAMCLSADDILLLALAGKSAQRLSEATGLKSSTIHSALHFADDNRLGQSKHSLPPVRVVIIDEVSTIGILIFYRLILSLSLMEPRPKIVLLGDSNQLESIEMGCVLKSLIDAGIPSIALQHNHRTSHSDFDDLTHQCLSGTLCLDHPGIQTIRAKNNDELIGMLTTYAGRIPAAYDIDLIHQYQLLAPSYSGQIGIDRLNVICQECLNPAPPLACTPHFKPGDKIQLTQNTNQYKNGEIGQIVSEQNGFLKIRLQNRTTLAKPSDVALAYVLSIHKFIGSEADVIVYISSFETTFELDKQLIYTMLTRAKRAIYIVTTNGKEKIQLMEPEERTCNFKQILQQELGSKQA
ncbi:ATP-dependent DNA helicase [Aeromonas veronii]|uniref:UvrD-like helicase C-terminal domain-containing protein n=1 Tax=Aeromonas veronii TaxID=654 RepID=A0A4S5CD08_AERVE|nr:ATP-dependent RecD-like DNA helicase [Aeromonas veronii]THJ43674.1 hypothetical protein E8Q35_15320 [Aeromonas veronii]